MNIRTTLLLVAIGLVLVGIWLMSHRHPIAHPAPEPRHVAAPADAPKQNVAIQDGKTIDFSSGKAQVKDDAKEKEAIAKGVADMQAASADVSFAPKPAPAETAKH